MYLAMHKVPSEAPYFIARDGVQSAVISYQLQHGSDNLPVLNTSLGLTVGEDQLYIIDICKLLESNGGILGRVPDGCAKAAGDDNDNCDSGDCACNSNGHYVWVTDKNGGVHSVCVGGGCKAYNSDEDQGVWP